MANTATIVQGIDTVAYIRSLKNQSTEAGELVPFRTSLDFDPKRDEKTTATSDGSVSKPGSLTTSLKWDMLNSISKVSDDIQNSLFDQDELEIWVVNRKRVKDGKYFAYYMRGYVTENSNSNAVDDSSKNSVTFTIDGTPKRGWLTLPADAQAELDYVFRGIDKVTGDSDTGDGTAWADSDRGAGANDDASSSKVTPVGSH